MPNSVKKFDVREVTDRAIAAGITPLQYMLEIMRAPRPEQGPDEDSASFYARLNNAVKYQLEAAKAAAPYCHAKIATEVVFPDIPNETKPIDIIELAKKVAFLFAMAENQPKSKQQLQ